MSHHFWRIGEALRQARKARRLSQEELSKQLGIGQATLSRVETSSDVRLGTLQQIARALDLEPMLVPRRLVPAVGALVRRGGFGDVRPYDPDDDERYDEADDDDAPGAGR